DDLESTRYSPTSCVASSPGRSARGVRPLRADLPKPRTPWSRTAENRKPGHGTQGLSEAIQCGSQTHLEMPREMDRGIVRLPVLLIGAIALLAGCAPAPQTSHEPAAAGARTTRTLRTSDQYEPATGVAIFAAWGISEARAGQIAWMFHSGLTAYDAQGNLQGRLARKIPSIQDGDWKVNSDGTMDVTWKIRPGVKWHDGTPLTAGDFAFGVQVARDPELPLPHTGGVDLIRDTSAPDAETLVIHW